jgi:hypothetical protein
MIRKMKKIAPILIAGTILVGCGNNSKSSNEEQVLQEETETSNTAKESSVNDDYETIMAIIDRIEEDRIEPLEWNNTVELDKNADALIKMAEDSTGRYEAYGVISEEKGCYGIILNDTIDGTDSNYNRVLKEWYYSGNDSEKPSFTWNDNNELSFTYQVLDNEQVKDITVKVDCGYDTGHMEFIESGEN